MTDYEKLSHYTRTYGEKCEAWRKALAYEKSVREHHYEAKQKFIRDNFKDLRSGEIKKGVYDEMKEDSLFESKVALEAARDTRRLAANEMEVAHENLMTYKKLMSIQ